MKKIFFGITALVAMLATSCQQDLGLVANGGETVNVSFNLATPQIASRAEFSDGETATHLQYAVYDAQGNILSDLARTNDVIQDCRKVVDFQLTTGNTYTVLFWAAAPGAPYTVDLAAKTMEVSYDRAVSSDESRDAFYFYSEPFTVTSGMAPISAELRRPFAQLNIGTNDYDASTSAHYTVTEAKVTTYAYKTLNFATGAVSGKDMVHFGFAPIPTDQVFPVQGYEYMAMNYLLMAETQETIDVVFTYTDGTTEKQRTVGAVPVQRNHRTNLYGQLLTSDFKVNVEIKPEYEDPMYNNQHGYYFDGTSYYINSAEGMKWMANEVNKVAAQAANVFDKTTVYLTSDIDMGGIEWTPIGDYAFNRTVFRGTFDGQGHTISNFKITESTSRTEKVSDCAYGLFGNVSGTIKNLNIDNAIITPNNKAKFAGALAGRLKEGAVVDNCHITNSVVTIENWQVGGIAGQVNDADIKNSSISNSTVTGMSVVGAIAGMVMVAGDYDFDNCEIKDCAIMQNASFSDAAKYDPLFGLVAGYVNASGANLNINNIKIENNTIKGAASSLLVGGNADGAKVVVDGVESSVASSQSMLNSALKADACVYLADGEYTIEDNFPAGATIIGAGENVVLNIQDKIYTVNGNATIENAKIAFSNSGYKGFQGNVDLNFKNCVIEGQPFLYGAKATFEGCTFVQTDPEQYNVWTYSVHEANFIDCVFNCAGKSVLMYNEANDLVQNVSFDGCTFNASAPCNGKAAIELGTSQLTIGVYTVTIDDTTVNGFANGSVSGNPLWNVKNGNRGTVVVDGQTLCLAGAELVGEGLWKSGSKYSVINAEGLALINSKMVSRTAGVGITIELLSDIDFTGKTWTEVDSHIDWNSTMNEFNGNNHTISNLTINGRAMFLRFSNLHDVVVKNVSFDNVTINYNGINAAVVVGQTYDNVLLENVDVKNSSITGKYKVAALIGSVYDEDKASIVATLKGCDVENTTVKSTNYDFCTAGMVAFVYADNGESAKFEDCTVSNLSIYAKPNGYAYHAAIYTKELNEDIVLFNEAEGVTVTNVTFEEI